ncbi:hypothetical protein [Halobellus ruber]|uniref:Uncharacterized protein n=1 Tax=Halobellus ruber TaxID=2761102 RepID=A0A7J9SGF7_9EURY|nr:hypothetical protein [Halobellus ruber]MBB6645047.1 hypothetical protein [Halobellus ruber]
MTSQRASTLRKAGILLGSVAVLCFVLAETIDTTSSSESTDHPSQSRDTSSVTTSKIIGIKLITTTFVSVLVFLALWGFFETFLGKVFIEYVGGILLSETYGVKTSGRIALGTSVLLSGFIFGYGLGQIPRYHCVARSYQTPVKTSISTISGAVCSFVTVLMLYKFQYRGLIAAERAETRQEILMVLDVAGMLPISVALTIVALVTGVVVRTALPSLQHGVSQWFNSK